MAEEAGKESSREKLLFYTTAFFILLAIFSLFGFLFLVPFVIEPACTTIMREFDEVPATCETIQVENLRGASNCSWTSCREGCTREIYECTQITVSYKVSVNTSVQSTITAQSLRLYNRFRRAVLGEDDVLLPSFEDNFLETPAIPEGNSSEWDFVGAKFFPNVKGCGYPPYLNCSIFHKKYAVVGKQYPCYYSTVEPALVIVPIG
ncbi:protein tipE-like [Diaphorina citri]|uniref:Protein tipE-like n=1 Tax=Diaphorina citri TaxID=121845 RepID=A0A1S3D4F3_DIACI|nr:protein tipE-like [Diaphorina citri]